METSFEVTYFDKCKLASAVPICWNVVTIWLEDVSMKNMLGSLAQFCSKVEVGSPPVLTCLADLLTARADVPSWERNRLNAGVPPFWNLTQSGHSTAQKAQQRARSISSDAGHFRMSRQCTRTRRHR
jgi:hypothetical protein